MAKEVEVKVMVSQLQIDDGIYRKGSIISLPPDKVMSLGNSVAVISKPKEAEKPTPVEFEEVITRYDAEEEPPKTKTPKKTRGK